MEPARRAARYGSGGGHGAADVHPERPGQLGWGGSSTDAVTVVVANQAPIADAGVDRTAFKRAPIALDGSGSADPEGDPLAFSWRQTGGPVVGIAGATTSTPAFSATASGTYAFLLTVSDGWGGTASDSVSIVVVNRPPTADAGVDRTVFKRTAVALDGLQSADPDGDGLAYAWTQESGPHVTLTNADHAIATFTPVALGTYTFRLQVNDQDGGIAEDAVQITVQGVPPAARLLVSPLVARAGASIGFDGRGSSDRDGVIVDFSFSFGDGVVIRGTDAVRSHTYSELGSYQVRLTVTDDDGNVNETTASVEIVSAAPAILNLKPLVAAVFAAVLVAAGSWSSRRRPYRTSGGRASAGIAFLRTSLPFVLAEIATGVVSYFTGLLTIPPLLGLGTVVDGAILGAGVALAAMRVRRSKQTRPTAAGTR
ncbi:MAG: PKD domain-containing protein [Methanobacteriota archaeon]|nr:MAG: PKD domain-containing protein [Euryarchaeota archaeon]